MTISTSVLVVISRADLRTSLGAVAEKVQGVEKACSLRLVERSKIGLVSRFNVMVRFSHEVDAGRRGGERDCAPILWMRTSLNELL